ncbi:hypothetical protein [Actinomadura mexicana]|uniref:Uncharacterized protein n=1 Tax=Actinomadura mexicana TaxID=134959 RepID=A0A238V209_9ACTN|nr:hypothetical protein [Actinomadura mexicana]SNR28181.1 hypothetical protein SAMN06265355_101776 [Actinomadura mexicana]
MTAVPTPITDGRALVDRAMRASAERLDPWTRRVDGVRPVRRHPRRRRADGAVGEPAPGPAAGRHLDDSGIDDAVAAEFRDIALFVTSRDH